MARAVFGLLGIAVRCDGTMQNSAGNGVVIDGLMRAVRAESANLKLSFHRGDLDDATVAAYNTAKRDRMEEVKAAVLLPLPAAEAEALCAIWRRWPRRSSKAAPATPPPT